MSRPREIYNTVREHVMCMRRLTTCCCGCTLRAGCQIIGGLQIAINTILFALMVYGLVRFKTRFPWEVIIIMGINFIYMGFAIMLIIGAAKEIAGLINAWIIFTLIWLAMSMLFLLQFVVSMLIDGFIEFVLVDIVTLGTLQGFVLYSVFVAYSHMRTITEARAVGYNRMAAKRTDEQEDVEVRIN